MFGIIQRHKRIAIILVAVVSLSFIFWMFSVSDIRQMFTMGSCVATVEGECITLREYRFELMKYSDLLRDEASERAVKRFVLNSLITKEALYVKAKELGLLVSDEEVIEEIKKYEAFKENGKFSVRKYKEVLNRLNLTPAEFEEIIRKSLMAQKVLNFVKLGVYVLPDEVEIQKKFVSTRFKGKLYLVKPKDVKIDYEPSEKEMRNYYDKNKGKFYEREKKVFYIWETKEKRKAQEIYGELKEGKIPEGYVKVIYPDEKEKFKIDFEKVKNFRLFKLKAKYLIVLLKEEIPKRLKKFEEVKDEIRKELIEKKRREKLKDYATEIFEKLKKGESVNVKPLTFEKTTLQEILRILNVPQEDTVKIVFGKEKYFGPYRTFNGYGILYIEKRIEEKLRKEELKSIENELLNNKISDLQGLFVDKLFKTYDIKVNEELIK